MLRANNSISRSGTRENRSGSARETTVRGSAALRSETSTNTIRAPGSSSILRHAFAASGVIRSTQSITTNLHSAEPGAYWSRRLRPRTSSMDMSLANPLLESDPRPGEITMTVGCVPSPMVRHERHVPHAPRTDFGCCSHVIAVASARATVRFPTSPGP